MSRRNFAALTIAAALIGPAVFETLVHAAATPEQKCQKARHSAAAKYAQCETKALGKFHGGGTTAELEATLSKCRVKYTDTWLKLQKNAIGTGATCDAPRFVDTGNGTVVDNLTGLEWEKKTNDGTANDKDDTYTWFNGYNTFLSGLGGGPSGLNEFPCFEGMGSSVLCSWRLPTRAELQTILSEPHPCTTDPCIDGMFGPTSSGFYWTATSHASEDTLAWAVDFATGFVRVGAPVGVKAASPNFVRAVRGGF